MIYLYFDYFGEKILIEVNGNKVWFSNSQYGNVKATIDHIQLNYSGVIKEFPDLRNNDNWKEIARQRFKDKIKSLNKENDIVNYLITDLKKFGYVPLMKQKRGFRTEVIR